MKHKLLFLALAISVQGFAQTDVYLTKLVDDVKTLRNPNSAKESLNKTVLDWSASGKPKLTLMDEIETDANEFKGKGVHLFKVNQVVAHVYNRQNVGLVSKDDYFNSTEQDIYYSAIEKSVPKGKTVTYTIKEHIGTQELFILSYDPKTKYTVTVNGKKAEDKGDGVQYISVPNVRKQDKMTVSITSDPSNKSKYDSFVILNHNPQK